MLKSTVRVVAPGTRDGWMNISTGDFDPKVHVRWSEGVVPGVAESEAVTVETVAKMKRTEVAKMLAQHGIQADPKTPVEELRSQLSGLLFDATPTTPDHGGASDSGSEGGSSDANAPGNDNLLD